MGDDVTPEKVDEIDRRTNDIQDNFQDVIQAELKILPGDKELIKAEKEFR